MALVPLSAIDRAALYDELQASGATGLWRSRGRLLTTSEFDDYVGLGVGASFAILSPMDSRPIGIVSLYRVDWHSSVGALSLLLLPDSTDHLGSSLLEYLDHCVDGIGLRKLVIEMPEPVLGPMKEAISRLQSLQLEGVQRRQYRFGQALVDQHIYGLFADEYRAERRALADPAVAVDDAGAFAMARDAVAEIVGCDTRELSGGSRVVAELGMDSLMMTELAATLNVTIDTLDSHGFGELTIHQLAEAVAGRVAPVATVPK